MASGNRAMRRKQARIEQKTAQLYKNGITDKDLQDSYNKGYKAGYQDKAWMIIESYYSATMLSLHDLFGFGQDRCIRTMTQIETNLINILTHQEMIAEVKKKIGIDICLDEAICRAQPIEKGK